jgi:uncharacterized membrane protein
MLVVVDSFGLSANPFLSISARHHQSQQQQSRLTFYGDSNSNCNCNCNCNERRTEQIRSARGTTTALFGFGGSMGSSLVAADDSWGNLAALSAVGVAAQQLGNSTAIGRLLGAPVTAMAITFGLASVGVLAPGGTTSSRSLQGLSIKFATPWILLGADFRGIGSSSRGGSNDKDSATSSSSSTIPLLFGFGLASLATLAGGFVGWKVIGRSLVASSLGPHNGLAIAAALLAKNIGGGINYVAVCAALQASPEAIATGLCIDNIGALVYFPISNLLASRYPDPAKNTKNTMIDSDTNDNDNDEDDSSSALATATTPFDISPRMTVESISVAFFAASTLLWLGDLLAIKGLKSPSAQIPIVTLLAVTLAGIIAPNIPKRSKWLSFSWLPRGLKTTCDTLGTVCLYLFFTTAGAPGIKVARSMTSALWPLSVFSVLLYAIHGGILASCYQFLSQESRFQKSWRQRRRREQNTDNADDNDDDDVTNNTVAAILSARPKSWTWRDIFSPQRLLVASSSAIGGPPTSVALARTVGWDSLVVPALLVGNVGYAISTFVGIGFYYFFKV